MTKEEAERELIEQKAAIAREEALPILSKKVEKDAFGFCS
jgi:hypothetical protein